MSTRRASPTAIAVHLVYDWVSRSRRRDQTKRSESTHSTQLNYIKARLILKCSQPCDWAKIGRIVELSCIRAINVHTVWSLLRLDSTRPNSLVESHRLVCMIDHVYDQVHSTKPFS